MSGPNSKRTDVAKNNAPLAGDCKPDFGGRQLYADLPEE